MSDMEPDLILVTESWCNGEVTNAYLSVAGYELQPDLRIDRTNTNMGRGGGLLVYTKTELQILKLDSNSEFHQHCKFSVRDIVVYLVYRSPNSPVAEMTKKAELIRGAEKDSVLIGDFNLPQVDWEGGTARGNSKEVLEAVEDMLMSQMVDFSTQVKGNILDLVITNMPERIQEVREEGRLGRSDHNMIVVEISVGKLAREEQHARPDWRKADRKSMKAELCEQE